MAVAVGLTWPCAVRSQRWLSLLFLLLMAATLAEGRGEEFTRLWATAKEVSFRREIPVCLSGSELRRLPMDIQDELIAEYDRELVSTRKMLDSIPADADLDWKANPKSMTLGRLAGGDLAVRFKPAPSRNDRQRRNRRFGEDVQRINRCASTERRPVWCHDKKAARTRLARR